MYHCINEKYILPRIFPINSLLADSFSIYKIKVIQNKLSVHNCVKFIMHTLFEITLILSFLYLAHINGNYYKHKLLLIDDSQHQLDLKVKNMLC